MRKKIIAVFSAVFFAAAFYCIPALASEKILFFESSIRVQKDASMLVTETIKVMSAGDQIVHGIYRDFPTRYRDKLGNRYVVDFKVKEVIRDGGSESYHTEKLGNGIRVYIGRKDAVISRGEHTFVLSYSTDRQLGFFKEFDELYWNVTGNGWSFPIEHVRASVELPECASGKIRELGGYTGPKGAKGSDFTSSFNDFGNAVFVSTREFLPGEGLTIVVSWPKGCVEEPGFDKQLSYFLKDNRSVIVGLIGLLVLCGYYMFVWYHYGRDPGKGTIFPLFSPPNKLSPAALRYVMKMGFDHKAFTAAVINMAVKGYLVIRQEQGVYSLKKTESQEEGALVLEEKVIAQTLFGSSSSLVLKNTNHTKVSSAIAALKQSLSKNFEKMYFINNKQYFFPGLALSVLVIIASAMTGSLERFPIALFMAVWLSGWSVGVTVLLLQVVSLWQAYATDRQNNPLALGSALFLSVFALPFVIGEVVGLGVFVHATSIPVTMILIVAVGLNFLFYHLLKAPTLLGRGLMDKIEGFKMYLGVAEKERLNLLNPVEKTPELFERYLPYALALDVEQQWSEKFAECLKKAAESGKEYSPAWYSGPGWHGHAGAFASGLGSSLSTAVSSSSVAPGSSSGGGGGGSSGGGGGGGGGGGW